MFIEEQNGNFAKPVLSAGVLRVLVACEESQAVTIHDVQPSNEDKK